VGGGKGAVVGGAVVKGAAVGGSKPAVVGGAGGGGEAVVGGAVVGGAAVKGAVGEGAVVGGAVVKGAAVLGGKPAIVGGAGGGADAAVDDGKGAVVNGVCGGKGAVVGGRGGAVVAIPVVGGVTRVPAPVVLGVIDADLLPAPPAALMMPITSIRAASRSAHVRHLKNQGRGVGFGGGVRIDIVGVLLPVAEADLWSAPTDALMMPLRSIRPRIPSTHVHHLRYQGRGEGLAGGADTFPDKRQVPARVLTR
jgi:hypothetical protein